MVADVRMLVFINMAIGVGLFVWVVTFVRFFSVLVHIAFAGMGIYVGVVIYVVALAFVVYVRIADYASLGIYLGPGFEVMFINDIAVFNYFSILSNVWPPANAVT